ncbi:MAG: signal peptide peptidase SppA [Propionibacterium sp.]|nr:MAG: signal peptide peptidase SppA [Propionibacterium sp.]
MTFVSTVKSFLPTSKTKIVLELDLSRGVLSQPPTNPLGALAVLHTPTMGSIREGLRKAASDDRVKGLVIHLGTAALRPAQIDELAQLIQQFAKSKPTVAFTETFGEFDSAVFAYKLAVAAETVWLQPSGMLSIGGLHLDITLLKGMLNKLGIEPQFGQRKEYKTAADQFAADEVTPANREMMTRLGQSLMDESVASIAAARGLSVEAVWDAVNNSPLTPQQAKEAGFIDQIGYRDQVFEQVHNSWGTEPTDQLFVHRYAEFGAITQLLPKANKPVIAVIDITGGIVSGRGEKRGLTPNAGADMVCERLRAVVHNDQIAAVILRVDSPGGSYVASDTIRRAVIKVRESGRPVVAVMGSVAASGGYFVSMPADEIIAQPSTLTGSIGVLAGKMVTRGLYEKIGLKREGIDIGARAGALSSNREFTEDDWAVLNTELDRIYEDFTTKAAKDRGLEYQVLEPLAHGRVWTGADAKVNNLIDHLGGMDLAIDRACSLAKVNRSAVKVRPIGMLGFLEQLIPARNSETLTAEFGVSVPSADELFVAAAQAAGINVAGVLSLPLVPKITG